jgi:hypothetical protein
MCLVSTARERTASFSSVLDEGAHAATAQLSQDIEHGRVVPSGIAGTDAQPSGQ